MMMVLAESDRIKKYCEAFQLLRGKNLDQAASKLRELAKEDPEYLNAHRYLGIVFLEMEEFKEAISELSLVVREGEGRPGKFHNDLKNRCDESIYGKEAREFEKEEDDNGHLAWAYHDLGMAYLWEDNYVEAERCLLEALKKSEKNFFRNDLGWAYYKWDKPDLAIEQYDRVIKNESQGKSGTGHANFFRGLALFKKGRLSLAQKELEKARRKFRAQANPLQADLSTFYRLMEASAINNLGRIKMVEGDYQEAKKRFQEGLAICEGEECQKYIDQLTPRGKRKEKKTIAALHNNLGLLYFNQGLLEGAKNEFKAALKSEELPETYNNLAAISNMEGAKEKAESYLKNALRLNPLSEAANANLGRLRGEDTSWWDWWFKLRSSESRLRGLVGGLLVIALILMVANMIASSFSGGEILPSVNNKTTVVQEDISKNITKDSSETTETKSTKTTTTETGPSLESKMLLTALIFFILVHPRIKVFTLGEAKFEMDTESVSSGSLYSEGAISS
jgi:tetratricopeptide (TPR) repeat protein